MKRKLGIITECISGMSSLDALTLAHNAGFEAFFTGEIDNDTVAALKKKGDEYGMDFEFIHAPFTNINTMWLSGLDYLKIFNDMKATIDVAAANNVPAIIAHVSSGWKAPEVNDLGIARFDEIVLYAKEKGVIVCFENLRMLGNLALFVDRYDGMDNVRFCFDCGHEHCYTKTVKWLDIFTTKLFATHIHDNHSRPLNEKPIVPEPDEHLLPFDGTYDYEAMIRKMDEYGYTGSLMLEVFNARHPSYMEMTPEEFIKTAYDRIKKISEI